MTTAPTTSATPTPAASPAPARTLRALERLRGRVRRMFLVDGLIAFVIALCLAVVITFVLDYLLGLPRGVRLVLILVCAVGLASVIARRLLHPRRVALPLEELAVLVEASNPELKQSLVTAVELTRPGSRSARYLSSDMIASVVADVERNLPLIGMNRVFQFGRLGRATVLLGLLVVAIGGGAAARPDLAGIWFRRVCLLGSERWPKSVQLVLVRPTSDPVTIALGEDLPVEVRAVRGDPTDVEIRSWSARSGQRSETRTELMKAAPDGRFRKVFPHVPRAFTFQVRGGDDVLPAVDVVVQIRPRISGVKVWCTYPAYTGTPPTPEEEPLRHGHLEVAARTEVRFEALTNVPVAEAFFRFLPIEAARETSRRREGEAGGASPDRQEPDWPPEAGSGGVELVKLPVETISAAEAAEVDEEGTAEFDRGRLTGSFTVKEDGYYLFHLRGENGLINRQPVRFRVKAIADRAPVVRVVEPFKVNEEVSPEASVDVKVTARDDHGVRSGSLRGVLFDVEGGVVKTVEVPLDQLAAADPDAASTEREADHVIDMAALGAAKGWRFQYLAEASDFGDNVGESEQRFLHVVGKEEILRLLQNRVMIVRDQIEEVQRQQESARKDLDEFARKIATRDALIPEDSGSIARHRQSQQRVTRGVSLASSELGRILEKMTQNRVGDQKDRQWLERVASELREVASTQSEPIERDLQALRDAAQDGSRTPQEIPPIVDEQRDIERALESIAVRLTEYGDVSAVIQQWRNILKRQLEIRETVIDQIQGPDGSR